MHQKKMPARAFADHLIRGAAGCGLVLLANVSFAQDDIPDLDGVWSFGSCSGGGVFNLGCMLLEEDDELLNSRARAYRDVIDEHTQPKYDCAPMPIPHMWTDPYDYMIEQHDDHLKIHYGKDDVIRTVWLEEHGPGTPQVNEFFYFGYSVGHYEGNSLVVVTDRFTFDPQGLNADFRIPSSTQKRVIERFTRNGNSLTLEVTTVDPVFLNAPWSFRVTSRLQNYEWDGYWGCDYEATRKDLKLTPPKYPDAPIERIEYQQ